MFTRKTTEKPNLPKEYVWELDINGETRVYRCVVTETLVTTYEGDVEKKHLKVMNPECRQGVLQIDTITSIYGDQVPFQLERFIPYIKLEGEWVSSDTTKKDRLDATVAGYKKNSLVQIVVGACCMAIALGVKLVTGEMGNFSMLNIFGIFFITGAIMTRVRLKQELDAMKEAETASQAVEETAGKEEKVLTEADKFSLAAPKKKEEA